MTIASLLSSQESLAVSGGVTGAVWAVLVALLHIALAAAVHHDAKGRIERQKPLAFFGVMLWSLAALVGGLVALALYWAVHYSTLRDKEDLPSRL